MHYLSPRAMKARLEGNGRARWRAYEMERQTRIMALGPRLLADQRTIVVPSEWYSEEAAEFWKAYGFQWIAGLSRWQRNTSQPASGKIYTVEVWMTATRRKFYEFWPTLKKTCTECGRMFAPTSPRGVYEVLCPDCKGESQDDVDIIERIDAVRERNRREYEELARMTGKTIAEIEADLTAPDLPQEENNDD